MVETVKERERGVVSVVMEHFNLNQQTLLDSYMSGNLSPARLQQDYDQGEEGHNISCYQPLLHYARQQAERVRLVAGFLPRGLARLLVREGEEAAYSQAQALNYLSHQDIQV
jgi:uncharacterized iron-regulated protein